MSLIINTYNTCFLNSIVQMLTSSEDIIESFDGDVYIELFNDYKTKTVINLNGLILYYKTKLQPSMIFGMHQDANEVLSYLLDDVSNKSKFQLKLGQVLKSNNEQDSLLEYTENILIVPLETSIQSSIDSYFKTELINTTEQKTIQKIRLNTPDYMFLTLLRMKYENNKQVKIDKEIDIEPYIEYGGKRYKVISYILHLGNTNYGHYKTLKIHEGRWTVFDDLDRIVLKNQEDGLKYQSNAYIYLLQREDVGVYNILNQHFKLREPKVETFIAKFVTLSKDERQALKIYYQSLDFCDRNQFINNMRNELGEFFNEGYFMDSLDMKNDEATNPLSFTDFKTVCKWVRSIRENNMPNFTLKVWFSIPYYDRILLETEKFC